MDCDLEEVDFALAIMWRTVFSNCRLKDCRFSGVQAHRLQFRGVDKESLKLSPLLLQNCEFE